jgi:hypothetical protein
MKINMVNSNCSQFSSLNRRAQAQIINCLSIRQSDKWPTLVYTSKRGFLKDETKEKLSNIASTVKDKSKKVAEKAYKNMPDSDETKKHAKTAAEFLKKVGKTAYSATKTSAVKAKEMYDQRQEGKNEVAHEGKQQDTKKEIPKEESRYFGSSKDTTKIAGKVSFIGRFFARVTKIFTKISSWFAKKIFGSLFSRARSGGIFKKYKDQLVTRLFLFLGWTVSLVVMYKAGKGYFKNRRFRKKDQEIQELKDEIYRLRTEIEGEIKEQKELRRREGK